MDSHKIFWPVTNESSMPHIFITIILLCIHSHGKLSFESFKNIYIIFVILIINNNYYLCISSIPPKHKYKHLQIKASIYFIIL